MALTIDVLAAQLSGLQQAVVSMQEEVKNILPRMNTATENLQQEVKKMDEKLEQAVNPLISADVINVLKKVG